MQSLAQSWRRLPDDGPGAFRPGDRATRFVGRLARDTLTVVLAGGRGTRLAELTHYRAKPAVPFGGKFRIVDFTLSNCINSGIRRIAVLTQYRPYSLTRHINHTWSFLRGEFGEFVELLPASQHVDASSWYVGTADAVYQNLELVHQHHPNLVLVLAGDHVYKMDYGPMLAYHLEQQADVTVGCIEVPIAEAHRYGVLAVDAAGRVVRFAEKPRNPEPAPQRSNRAMASMGIYVFGARFLTEQLESDAHRRDSSHDFGRDIVPRAVHKHRVVAYPFVDVPGDGPGYWRDVGTVDAYWEANMELVEVVPALDLYDPDWPIWTYQEQLPPAKFVFDEDMRRGTAIDSMVASGCIVSGALLRRALLFSGSRVDPRARVEDSLVLPYAWIGERCRIHRAVIDEGCNLPPGTRIGCDREADARRYRVSESGVTLVTPEMLGQPPPPAR